MLAKCSQKDKSQNSSVKLLQKEKCLCTRWKKQRQVVPINVFCKLQTNNKECLYRDFRYPPISQTYSQIKCYPQANFNRNCSYCSKALYCSTSYPRDLILLKSCQSVHLEWSKWFQKGWSQLTQSGHSGFHPFFVSLDKFTETAYGQGMKVLRRFLEANSHYFQWKAGTKYL